MKSKRIHLTILTFILLKKAGGKPIFYTENLYHLVFGFFNTVQNRIPLLWEANQYSSRHFGSSLLRSFLKPDFFLPDLPGSPQAAFSFLGSSTLLCFIYPIFIRLLLDNSVAAIHKGVFIP